MLESNILVSQQTMTNPFRFRIRSVKSAQLFQLSAEKFFRLHVRYESEPFQWHVNGSNFRNRRWHNLFQKWNRIGSKSDETIVSESYPNSAVVVPTWHYLFGISAELCRLWDYFMLNCADFETIFQQNCAVVVPNFRLFLHR